MAGAFEYRQAEEIRDAFARHRVRYLFLGNSGMILLGFPDTTQDAYVYVEKTTENGNAIVHALAELGFQLRDNEAQEIICGKDFVQLKYGPFDLDLVFAPDGIENFRQNRRHAAASSLSSSLSHRAMTPARESAGLAARRRRKARDFRTQRIALERP